MTDCVHHWVLESPNGPTSKAVCEKCDAKDEFPNAVPENPRWTQQAFRKKNERTVL